MHGEKQRYTLGRERERERGRTVRFGPCVSLLQTQVFLRQLERVSASPTQKKLKYKNQFLRAELLVHLTVFSRLCANRKTQTTNYRRKITQCEMEAPKV